MCFLQPACSQPPVSTLLYTPAPAQCDAAPTPDSATTPDSVAGSAGDGDGAGACQRI
eukprot:gene19368-biopygen956